MLFFYKLCFIVDLVIEIVDEWICFFSVSINECKYIYSICVYVEIFENQLSHIFIMKDFIFLCIFCFPFVAVVNVNLWYSFLFNFSSYTKMFYFLKFFAAIRYRIWVFRWMGGCVCDCVWMKIQIYISQWFIMIVFCFFFNKSVLIYFNEY